MTQIVSGSKKPGPPKDAGSVRDQAKKTGENREKVRRSLQRAEKIGTERLEKVKGTSARKQTPGDPSTKTPPENPAKIPPYI